MMCFQGTVLNSTVTATVKHACLIIALFFLKKEKDWMIRLNDWLLIFTHLLFYCRHKLQGKTSRINLESDRFHVGVWTFTTQHSSLDSLKWLKKTLAHKTVVCKEVVSSALKCVKKQTNKQIFHMVRRIGSWPQTLALTCKSTLR